LLGLRHFALCFITRLGEGHSTHKTFDILAAAFEILRLLDDRRLNKLRDLQGSVASGVGLRGRVSIFGCDESLGAGATFTA
jgi:hypothetical protein